MMSTRDSLYHHLLTAGWEDEDSGDSEAPTGYFALFHFTSDCWADVIASFGNEPEFAELSAEEIDKMIRGWHVVVNDSQGFIHVLDFESEESARAEFNRRYAEYSAWSAA